MILKNRFLNIIAEKSDFSIIEMEVDKDHIHILVKSSPKISALQIVRRLKHMSTHQIWEKYPTERKSQFWKEKTFRSDGYFVCSSGNASRETIEKYIQSQG